MQGIDKEGQKVAQTTKSPMALLRDQDPMQAVREFKAAENELMVSLGKEALGPAIEALKSLTAAIKSLSEWAKAHPETAKDIVLIGGGLSILAKGAGEVALVVYLGAPMITGIRALAGAVTLFAVGTPAGLALFTLSADLTALSWALSGFHLPEHLFGPPSPEEDQRMRQQMRRDHPSTMTPDYDPDTGRPVGKKMNYLAPDGGFQPVINVTVKGEVDRQVLLSFVAKGLMGNPGVSGGMTGVDLRASPVSISVPA